MGHMNVQFYVAKADEGMAALALAHFNGQVLLILSGDDYTAKEFTEYAASNPAWQGHAKLAHVSQQTLAQADHTFSRTADRIHVETMTLNWLPTLCRP